MELSEGDRYVFGAIAIEGIRVVLFAIDLNPRFTVDNKVDTLVRLQSHLRGHVTPGETEPCAGEAFRKRFTVGIDPLGDGPQLARESLDEKFQIRDIHQSAVKRPVENRDRLLKRFVQYYCADRVSQRDAP